MIMCPKIKQTPQVHVTQHVGVQWVSVKIVFHKKNTFFKEIFPNSRNLIVQAEHVLAASLT